MTNLDNSTTTQLSYTPIVPVAMAMSGGTGTWVQKTVASLIAGGLPAAIGTAKVFDITVQPNISQLVGARDHGSAVSRSIVGGGSIGMSTSQNIDGTSGIDLIDGGIANANYYIFVGYWN